MSQSKESVGPTVPKTAEETANQGKLTRHTTLKFGTALDQSDHRDLRINLPPILVDL